MASLLIELPIDGEFCGECRQHYPDWRGNGSRCALFRQASGAGTLLKGAPGRLKRCEACRTAEAVIRDFRIGPEAPK